jgi:hypothetical protein
MVRSSNSIWTAGVCSKFFVSTNITHEHLCERCLLVSTFLDCDTVPRMGFTASFYLSLITSCDVGHNTERMVSPIYYRMGRCHGLLLCLYQLSRMWVLPWRKFSGRCDRSVLVDQTTIPSFVRLIQRRASRICSRRRCQEPVCRIVGFFHGFGCFWLACTLIHSPRVSILKISFRLPGDLSF